MKKILLLLVLSVQVFAISSLSTLGESEKNLLNSILKQLKIDNISEEKKQEVYNTFNFALEKDWYAKWNSNDTLTSSKVGNAETQFVDLSIIDENRIYNVTFIYFNKQKQLIVGIKQYISGSPKLVLEINDDVKKDKKYENKIDKENYAVYSQKEYANDTVIYVDGTTGMVMYNRMVFINL